MALKVGYFYSPFIVIQVPPFNSDRNVPLFDAALAAAGGVWGLCWNNSDAKPLFGVFKVGVDPSVDFSTFATGGVAYLAGTFEDAQQAASSQFQIGDANASLMSDQILPGE